MSNKSYRRFHATPCRSTANERHLHMPLPFSGLPLILEQNVLAFLIPMEEAITLGKGASREGKERIRCDKFDWLRLFETLPLPRLVRLRQYDVEAGASHPRDATG